jgi:hypothetical protein
MAFALALTIGLAMPLAFELGLLLVGAIGAPAARVAVPLLAALPFYPLWLAAVRRGALSRATLLALAWALAASVSTIAAVAATGDRWLPVIVNGAEYRAEMFSWIRTGVGEESDPSRFIPLHATHFAAFALLAFVSCGALALALGAALLAYMNFYVGSLIRVATEPAAVALLGWPPYAILRVVGFVLVAAALAAFARARLARRPAAPSFRRCLGLGVALVVTDALVKALIAPAWGELLRGITAIPGP